MQPPAKAEGTANVYPLQEAVDRIIHAFAWGGATYLIPVALRIFQAGTLGTINAVSILVILGMLGLLIFRRILPTSFRAVAILNLPSIAFTVNAWYYFMWPGSYCWFAATILSGALFFGTRRGLLLTLPLPLVTTGINFLHALGVLSIHPPEGIPMPTPMWVFLLNGFLIGISCWVIVIVSRIQIASISRTSRRFRDLFAGVHESVLIVDPQGRILESNPSAQSQFEATNDQLRTLTVADLDRSPLDGLPSLSEHLPAMPSDTPPAPFLCRMSRQGDKAVFWAEVVVNPIELDGAQSLLLSIHDIDEIVRAREELAALNENLERKVHERTRQLAQSNEELEATMQDLVRTQSRLAEQERMASLSRMVAGVAHELNTPLGNILSCTELLRQDSSRLSGEFADAHHPSLQRIGTTSSILDRAARQAAQLVRQFKQVAVDSTSHGINRIELLSFLESQRLQLQHRQIEFGTEIRIDCPSSILLETHPSALAQLLILLTDNAFLHGRHGDAPPSVSWIARQEGDLLVLEIRDQGPGMPLGTLPHLFSPFFVGQRERGGIGLGAHIAWNLATTVLQGSLEARNASPGLSLTLRIPLEENAAPAP